MVESSTAEQDYQKKRSIFEKVRSVLSGKAERNREPSEFVRGQIERLKVATETVLEGLSQIERNLLHKVCLDRDLARTLLVGSVLLGTLLLSSASRIAETSTLGSTQPLGSTGDIATYSIERSPPVKHAKADAAYLYIYGNNIYFLEEKAGRSFFDPIWVNRHFALVF